MPSTATRTTQITERELLKEAGRESRACRDDDWVGMRALWNWET